MFLFLKKGFYHPWNSIGRRTELHDHDHDHDAVDDVDVDDVVVFTEL